MPSMCLTHKLANQRLSLKYLPAREGFLNYTVEVHEWWQQLWECTYQQLQTSDTYSVGQNPWRSSQVGHVPLAQHLLSQCFSMLVHWRGRQCIKMYQPSLDEATTAVLDLSVTSYFSNTNVHALSVQRVTAEYLCSSWASSSCFSLKVKDTAHLAPHAKLLSSERSLQLRWKSLIKVPYFHSVYNIWYIFWTQM